MDRGCAVLERNGEVVAVAVVVAVVVVANCGRGRALLLGRAGRSTFMMRDVGCCCIAGGAAAVNSGLVGGLAGRWEGKLPRSMGLGKVGRTGRNCSGFNGASCSVAVCSSRSSNSPGKTLAAVFHSFIPP